MNEQIIKEGAKFYANAGSLPTRQLLVTAIGKAAAGNKLVHFRWINDDGKLGAFASYGVEGFCNWARTSIENSK